MHLKIKVLDEKLRTLYTERLNHNSDSGFDLFIPDEHKIPNDTLSYKIDHKVQMSATNDNGDPVGYYLIPRSSIIKTPLRMANSIGLIDMDYRGNIMSVVDNHQKTTEQNIMYGKYYKVDKGSRLFQIVAFDGSPITFELVDDLDVTDRGTGGYGSTGK